MEGAAGLLDAPVDVEVRVAGRPEDAPRQHVRVDDVDEVRVVLGQLVLLVGEDEQRLRRVQPGDVRDPPRLEEVRDHAGGLPAEAEADDVQPREREDLPADHEVEQLRGAVGDHRQVLHRLDVARLGRQRVVVDADHVEVVVLEQRRPDLGVGREVLVAGVAVQQHDDGPAGHVRRVQHALLVGHVQLRGAVLRRARVQEERHFRVRTNSPRDAAIHQIRQPVVEVRLQKADCRREHCG